MTVRARVAVAMLAVVVPAVVLVAVLTSRSRREAAVEATVAAVLDRMEAGGRARCEADPARFGGGPRARGAVRPRGPLAGARLFAYDASLAPASPRAPRLDPAAREVLDAEGAAIVAGSHPRRPAIAIRMPWGAGPCAVVLVQPRGAGRLVPRRPILRDLGLALAVLALAVAVALVALGPPLRRLRRLAAEVRRIAEGGYRRPTSVGGCDEIAEVAGAFDEAARRVREQVESLTERDRALTDYVDATTHDLAIPLTVLQGRLSEADRQLRDTGRVDAAVLAGALGECQYLDQLVGNMAAAARLEAGEPHVARTELDLVSLVERVAVRFEPAARHRGLSLEHAVPAEPVRTTGDDILLERAVSNLVHNAIRHRGEAARAEGGHVALVLEVPRDTGGARSFRVTVLDDGPGLGLDDEALGRLARGEEAPGARAAGRGPGLGLRIVRAVAAAHGLRLSFARGPEGGLLASLEGRIAEEG